MKKEFFFLTAGGILAWTLWYTGAELVGHEIQWFRTLFDILICPITLVLLTLFMRGIRNSVDCGTGVKFLLPIVLGLCVGIYAWNRSIIGMPPIEGIDESFTTKWSYSSSFAMAYLAGGLPIAVSMLYWFSLHEEIYKSNAIANMLTLFAFGFCVATILAGALAALGILAAIAVLIGAMFLAEKIEWHFFSSRTRRRAKVIKITPPSSRVSTTTHTRRS